LGTPRTKARERQAEHARARRSERARRSLRRGMKRHAPRPTIRARTGETGRGLTQRLRRTTVLRRSTLFIQYQAPSPRTVEQNAQADEPGQLHMSVVAGLSPSADQPDRLNASSKSLSTRSTCSVEWTRYREAGKLPDRLHLLNQQAQGHQERCVRCACDEVAPGSWVQCTVTCGKDIRLRTIRSRGDEQCLNSVSVWSTL